MPDHLVEEAEKIHTYFDSYLQKVRENVFPIALTFLEEDIRDPRANGPGIHPDAFMFRANHIGLALFDNGFFGIAEKLYRVLLQKTIEYRDQTENWRHAGALYANIAGACAAQGNIDQAVIELLKAAEDDKETYGIKKQQSFALTGLLQAYFADPIRDEILNTVQQVNQNIALSDVKSLSTDMGDREYAFLAYARLASMHVTANLQFPNEFSKLQVFSAFRSLSSLLEVELKTINGNLNNFLFPTLRALYGKKGWWQDFEKKRKDVGAVRNSNTPVDDRLRDGMAIVTTDDDSLFWKSLLISYIVRNYTIHQLEIHTNLVQSYSEEAFGHIVHVLIAARKHK